jgi:pyruvate dehydrogenase E2 component (dihydrolipoamide acetyltransferase)
VSANKGEITVEEPTRAQRAIARRSAESRATVPHLELSAEVDMAACLGRFDGIQTEAMIVRACALALRETPRANAAYRDGRFELYSRVNVAVPVAGEDGYVLATVFDADRKHVAELAEEFAGLRGRTLTAPELAGATFSVWKLDGVSSASPLIVPPHAAALGAGEVRETARIRGGAIVAGHSMTITLACDHRILYGPEAAAFLNAVRTGLEAAAL